MVPKGWEVKNLKDITLKIQDGNYGAKYPKVDELVDKGIPFLTSKALGGSGKTNPKKYDFITIEKHIELKKAHITTNDILFTNRGANVGVIGIAGSDLSDANIGPQLTLIRSNEKLVRYDYLYFFMKSSFFQKQVQGQDSGSAMNFFGIKSTEQFKIKIPPLPEQQKIAKILSTWDKAISMTERLIENSTQQKKALMQQLLTGKKRLLDDSGIRFKDEWNKVKLGDICLKVTDGAHHSPQSVEAGYPMYSVKDMTSSGFRKNSARLISKEDFDQLVNQNCKPELNDILIAKDGSILKYCFVVKEKVEGVILSSIALLRPNLEQVFPEFIAQYFSQDYIKFFVGKALTSGSGVPRIVLKDFKGIQIALPSINEQQKIATVLTNADREIELLEQQLADLQQEKKALMQVLLTGKKRVVVDGEG